MGSDRRQEQLGAHEAERTGEPEPEAVPADPHALLALQRSAGNAAVGRMLSRFYTRQGDGTLKWTTEPWDPKVWTRTGWTTWKLIPYGVYEKVVPDAPQKKKKNRRGKRGANKATTATAPALEAVETEDELEEQTPEDEAQEEPEEQQGELPPSVLPDVEEQDDGGGWSDVRSRGAVRAEREMARDVDGLAGFIDDHEGEAAEIGTAFNQLFNARVRQGLEVEGSITSSYATRFDRDRGGYSVEVTIPGLDNWVIHAHLDSTGALAPGENAIHYKRLTDRYVLGVSIALTPRQINGLLPDEATRAGWQTDQRRGNL